MAHPNPYCSVYEVKKAVGILTTTQVAPTVDPITGEASPQYPGLTTDDAEIARIIDQMSNYIDSMISNRYTTPVVGTIPGVINIICQDITVPRVYKNTVGIPPDDEANRLEAEKKLRMIHSGELIVGGLTGSETTGEVVQPFETPERGSYNDNYNRNSGLAAHPGIYDRR